MGIKAQLAKYKQMRAMMVQDANLDQHLVDKIAECEEDLKQTVPVEERLARSTAFLERCSKRLKTHEEHVAKAIAEMEEAKTIHTKAAMEVKELRTELAA